MAGLNALPFVESSLDLRGAQFEENRASWEPIIDAFEQASRAVTAEAEPNSQLKHQSRGQLLGEPTALMPYDILVYRPFLF